jgi:Polyketide cyclase / dehydrase and lipid transport
MLAAMGWYALEPADETFFETAPFVHSYPVDLDVPPDVVWESLTSERSMWDWKLPVKRLTWTSPRPFGPGTTREVILTGSTFGIRERYFRWEDGRRKSFAATECDRRLLRRFAEDYLVEPRPGGSRFTWTIALEPLPKVRWLFGATDPINAVFFRAVPRAAQSYFARS